MNEPVTLNAKRTWEWVFVCAGCDLLASSARSDALTCSPACRVRAHRNGSIKRLKAIAYQVGVMDGRTGKPKPEGIGHAQAINQLCPHLSDSMRAGTLTLYQAMPETYRAFCRLCFEQHT